MPTMSSEYKPNSLVVAMHSVPHLDRHLEPASDSFDLNYTYIQSILPVPIIVLLYSLITWIVLFAISCSMYNKMAKKSHNLSFNAGQSVICIVIIICIVLCFASVGKSIIGLETFQENIKLLEEQFINLSLLIGELVQIESFARSQLYSTICASLIPSSMLIKYDEYSRDMVPKALKFQLKLQNINLSKLFVGAETFTNIYSILFYSILAFEMLIVIIILICHACMPRAEYEKVYKISFVLFIITELIIILLISLFMIFLIIVADFCVDPVGGILSFFPNPTKNMSPVSLSSIAEYYLTCSLNNHNNSSAGITMIAIKSNTFISEMTNAMANVKTELAAINKYSKLLSMLGIENAAICSSSLQVAATNTSQTLREIREVVSCDNIQGIIASAIDEGVCNVAFTNWWIIWMSQIILLIVLFVLAILYFTLPDKQESSSEEIDTVNNLLSRPIAEDIGPDSKSPNHDGNYTAVDRPNVNDPRNLDLNVDDKGTSTIELINRCKTR